MVGRSRDPDHRCHADAAGRRGDGGRSSDKFSPAEFQAAATDCTPGPNKALAGCVYNGQDVSGANFSGSDFRAATFNGANVSGSNFSNANLRAATFNGANLSCSEL